MTLHFPDFDTRLAVYALIFDADGRLLLSWYNAQNGGHPCWTLPGGGVDYDEQLPDALAREVHEETGYLIEVGPVLTTDVYAWTQDRWQGRPGQSVRIIYLANIVGGRLGTIEQGGSTDRAEWLDLSTISDAVPIARIVDTAFTALTERAPG